MSQPTKLVDAFYSAKLLAALLGFSVAWVLRKIKAGEFGPECVLIDGDYRVPAKSVNAFLECHRVKRPQGEPPVFARSVGELRRKINESKRLDGD